jgi:hypothetical protein
LLRGHAVPGLEMAQQLPITQSADSPSLVQDAEIANECRGRTTHYQVSSRRSLSIVSSD